MDVDIAKTMVRIEAEDRTRIEIRGCKLLERMNTIVSLISIVCKICEKVIKKQWTEYFEREGVTDRQFGFRIGRSCVTNL